MRCHEVDYEIIGHDMQMVEVELDPGETVIAEAGAMNYMEDGIQYLLPEMQFEYAILEFRALRSEFK